MTAEDIIQRLLDKKHITVREAMILLRAITKEVKGGWFTPKRDSDLRGLTISDPIPPSVVCSYGVPTPPSVTFNSESDSLLNPIC